MPDPGGACSNWPETGWRGREGADEARALSLLKSGPNRDGFSSGLAKVAAKDQRTHAMSGVWARRECMILLIENFACDRGA